MNHSQPIKLPILLLGLLSLHCALVNASDAVKVFNLSTTEIETKITPDVGGRLFYFGLKNHENFLRVGPELNSLPHPNVTPESPNIGYLGFEIWVGPQSEWWTHQSLNPSRKAEKASWPPDPYLVQTSQNVIQQTSNTISLESEASPISGVSIQKTFKLNPTRKNSLDIQVRAKNERKESIAWDIWFNARVFPQAHIYVPVRDQKPIQTKIFDPRHHAPFDVSYQGNYLLLKSTPPPEGKRGRDGKVNIQPSEGWMAAFYRHQVFIIQFKLQPKELIHPEQGQVELFQMDEPAAPEHSLIEMEVHAPYKQLLPGETMSASEKWTLVEYLGNDSIESEMDFLNQLNTKLKLNQFE